MKKNIKKMKITVMSILVGGLLFFGSYVTAFAYTDSYEPNDTIDTAIQITPNTAKSSKDAVSKIVSFINSPTDEDWYKVSLSAGKQTLTLMTSNGLTVDAEIIAPDQETTVMPLTTFGDSSLKQIKFNASVAGNYYVHVLGHNGSYSIDNNHDYGLSVGNPYYTTGYYTKGLNQTLTITKSSPYSQIVNFDLKNESTIPDEAIILSVKIGGTETGTAYGRTRSIRTADTTSWITTKEYTFENTQFSPAVSPIRLKQAWQFQHYANQFYTSTYGLNPSIYFTYSCEMFK